MLVAYLQRDQPLDLLRQAQVPEEVGVQLGLHLENTVEDDALMRKAMVLREGEVHHPLRITSEITVLWSSTMQRNVNTNEPAHLHTACGVRNTGSVQELGMAQLRAPHPTRFANGPKCEVMV